MVYQRTISIQTQKRTHWVDLSREVQQVVSDSNIQTGTCSITSLHTTGGITINENADPDVERDFFFALNQLVPVQGNYRHSEGNSDSHIKTSLVGLSAHVPVDGGKIIAGTWQSVYFCEFDGPRRRQVNVTVMGE